MLQNAIENLIPVIHLCSLLLKHIEILSLAVKLTSLLKSSL